MAKKRTTVEFNDIVSEVLVEIPENEPAPWPKDAKLNIVGKPLPRVDGYEKVSGKAKFTYDINLPQMVWMKIIHSPYPHCRTRGFNTAKVKAMPGVHMVLMPEDVKEFSWYGGRSKLLDTTLRFCGDEVAAVVAETEAIAREAATALEVDYQQLPFVLDPELALDPDAPQIWESGNLMGGKPRIYKRGDIEAGFADADFTVEETFRSQTQVHACLETHCSVARWSGNKLTVWDSTQSVHPNRQALAHTLNLPLASVRLISLYCGGGFGSKLFLNKYTVLAALAARQLGRPVKVVIERPQEAVSQGNRPMNIMTIKAGCKKDGTLTALYLKSIGAVGAYPAGAGSGTPTREVYKCANVQTDEYNVHINADPARPHRAPGRVQGTWALDQAMDMLAEKCGIDPLEFRRRNYADGDQAGNKPYSSKGLLQAYEKGAEEFGWATRENRRRKHSKGARRRGFGLATQIWAGAGGPPAYAIIKLQADGSVSLLSGAQDIGTGTRTVAVQVAAEELGVPVDTISITIGDTQSTPYGFLSGGSLTAASITPAIRMAAADTKRQLLDHASQQMKLPAEQLATRGGFVFDSQNSDTRKSFRDVMAGMRRAGQNTIIGKGWRGPNPDDVTIRSWGVQFAEVEVDTDTGTVKVIKIVAAHEVGRVLNPLTASSQIEGGVIQGIGFALMEERVLNAASGRVVNANLHDYKIPTALDIPEIVPVLIDLPDPKINSVGLKGLGEPPLIPTAAAIANAIYDAVGTRMTVNPMTPQRVLEALERKEA